MLQVDETCKRSAAKPRSILRGLSILLILGLVGCDRADEGKGGSDVPDTPEDHLVGWWKFDDGIGETATDSSSFDNVATIKDGEWSDGKVGGALKMNGGNDSIVLIPVSESLKTTADEITVMAWTYRVEEHNVAVVAHEYPTLFFGFHGPQFKWEIQDAPGLLARAAFKLGFSPKIGAACYADPKYRAELDQWMHMAATFDGSTIRLYVDGVEICSKPYSGSIGMPDSPFTISGYLDKDGKIIDEITGMVDDIRIYNRALNEAEIRSVYSETGP